MSISSFFLSAVSPPPLPLPYLPKRSFCHSRASTKGARAKTPPRRSPAGQIKTRSGHEEKGAFARGRAQRPCRHQQYDGELALSLTCLFRHSVFLARSLSGKRLLTLPPVLRPRSPPGDGENEVVFAIRLVVHHRGGEPRSSLNAFNHFQEDLLQLLHPLFPGKALHRHLPRPLP